MLCANRWVYIYTSYSLTCLGRVTQNFYVEIRLFLVRSTHPTNGFHPFAKMASLPSLGRGSGRGPGGQATGQDGLGTLGDTPPETATQTMHTTAITVDFDVSDWVSNNNGSVPSFKSRALDFVSFLTKHVVGTQLAPLPYGGGEHLPCVGRPDKASKNIASS